MENLKNKSTLNIDAARLLINKKMYNPSIHCSYYSIFQLTMVGVCEKKGISLDDLRNESKEKKKNSHDYTINEFFRSYSRNERLKAVDIQRNTKIAKEFRHKADYSIENVDEETAEKQLKLAIDTIDLIKKII